MNEQQQFDYDYNQTFKVEENRELNSVSYLIYSGRITDKKYLITPSIAFFNFDTREEADKFVNQLNKIADKTNHHNK
ncbi:MAG: hypothetical protein ACPH9V_05085 [Flavobacteriaceae bacterium]